jgi:hypothetical protein
MQALLRFSHIAAESTFTTAELHPQTAEALGCPITELPPLLLALRPVQAQGQRSGRKDSPLSTTLKCL